MGIGLIELVVDSLLVGIGLGAGALIGFAIIAKLINFIESLGEKGK